MYEKHFGLKRRPFATTADTSLYYPATGHENAFKRIADAIEHHEGFAMLCGEAGVGKTLLSHRVLEKFGESMATAWVYNTHVPDAAAFFQAILYDLDLPYQNMSEQELRLQFTEHVLKTYKDGKPTLLVIDEAHHLKPALLEELRLLANLETRQGKALHIMLVGGPALMATIQMPELKELNQRIRAKVILTGMDVHEGVDYLLHHIRAAGGRPERIMSDEALEILARGTRGVSRLLNQAAQAAFHQACEAEQIAVDAEAAVEALNELGLKSDMEASSKAMPEDGPPTCAVKCRSDKRHPTPKAPPSPKRAVPLPVAAKKSA